MHLWPPRSARDVDALIQSRQLVETAGFDAKEKLPSSKELAKDIAAMATDGGIIIIGIGEDENKQPTRSCPIALHGVREVVTNVVHTCISEPPAVSVVPLVVDEGANVGYLLIRVPQSDRAPHMVIVGGDHRYYRRDSTSNRPLNESEVALRYQLRSAWQENRSQALDREISRLSHTPAAACAVLHLLCRPVIAQERLLIQLGQDHEIPGKFPAFEAAAFDGSIAPHSFGPDFSSLRGWSMTSSGVVAECNRKTPLNVPLTIKLGVTWDGSGFLFCDCAGLPDDANLEGATFVDFVRTLGLVRRFLVFMAHFYQAVQFNGIVDVGLALRNLHGARVFPRGRYFASVDREYHAPEFRAGFRSDATMLAHDYRLRSSEMLDPFFRALGTDQWMHMEGMPQDLISRE